MILSGAFGVCSLLVCISCQRVALGVRELANSRWFFEKVDVDVGDFLVSFLFKNLEDGLFWDSLGVLCMVQMMMVIDSMC